MPTWPSCQGTYNNNNSVTAGGGLLTPSCSRLVGALPVLTPTPLATPPFRVGGLAPSILAVLTVDQGGDGPRHSGAYLHHHRRCFGCSSIALGAGVGGGGVQHIRSAGFLLPAWALSLGFSDSLSSVKLP